MAEHRDDPSLSTVDMDMRDVRPASDRVGMERARARAELALFGTAEPARFGRYRILDPIAGGGMGLVYGAYDPELDRKVALKVLHPGRGGDERSRRRLTVEARALAKLDHPNVVKVHDVLTVEGQVVIVMELVDGQTLAAWEESASRTWREALDVYLQAGDGLAAAHGVDVIHRDFKPSNAIVGADGRVRVLDFGLARSVDGPDPVGAPRAATTDIHLTHTGDVVGTLGYASPEQLRAEPLTAASDQFSFAVSLYHTVEGVAPFAGATLPARLASIDAGPRPPDNAGKHAPSWLRAVIARGLSPNPSDRYPTLAEMLEELRRPRGWRRWRTPVVIAGFAIASAGVAFAMSRGSDVDACDGGKRQIAGVWSPAARDGVLAVLDRIGTPYAKDVSTRVADGLDTYARDWSTTHRAACTDHRQGTTSAAMLDRQMTCLRQRLGDLGAAAEVVAKTDAGSLTNVMDVVARMPAVSRCADIERLQAEVELPDGEELRARVGAVREEVSGAEALSRAGRSEAARTAAAAALDHARATTYAPVQVEAALAAGRILMTQRELPAAVEPLTLARDEALELRMFAAGIEAAARLMYIEGVTAANAATLERELAYALPLCASHDCDRFARPLLLNNVGTVYLAMGQRAEALKYFADARADLGDDAGADLELTVIDRNLAMLTSDPTERIALSEHVWHRLREALGEQHPATIDALMAYAEYVPDPERAYELMSKAAAGFHEFHPTLVEQTAIADTARAFLASELGDPARTAADYETAIATTTGATDADIAIMHDLLVGELAVVRGDAATAVDALARVSDRRLASERWYEREEGLRAEVGLGLAERARGRDADAGRHLEVAVAGYPSIIAVNEQLQYRRLFARAQRALASVLRRTGKDAARADVLDREADAFDRATRGVSGKTP